MFVICIHNMLISYTINLLFNIIVIIIIVVI